MLENLFKNAKSDAEVYGALAVVITITFIAFVGVVLLFFISYLLLTM
jgi:hypothetical protein